MNKQTRNLILYTLGHSISALGSIIYSFAIGLYVLNSTGSGMKFAFTLLISFIPSLLITPFAGVIADKVNRKKIVVSMDFLNGLLFTSFYIIIQLSSLNLTGIYITAFLTNIITTFFSLAFQAARPQLVYETHFHKINAISQLIHAGTAILGPVFGGIVYAVMDIKSFILINGVSFILSGISELAIDFNLNSKAEKVKEFMNFKSVINSMKEGVRYVIHKKNIMSSYFFFVGINILVSFGIQVPLPYILNNHLEIGSYAYGIINSFLPVGMILGALIVEKVVKRIQINKLFLSLGFISGMLTVMVGLPFFIPAITSTSLFIYLYFTMILFSFGMMISLIDVPFATLIQNEVEEAFLGRVWGSLLPMIKVINPIGYLLSGFLLDVINPFLIPFISGSIFIIYLLFFGKSTMVREPVVENA